MPTPSRRIEGIDVARAVATLAMIQTHAYDAWVEPAGRQSPWFTLTRILGTLPLPMFLMLAGISVSLRVHAGLTRQQSSALMRSELVRSALQVLACGYALNVLFGVLDGAQSLDVFLRADVLHAIGLSLLIVSSLSVRGESAELAQRLRNTSICLLLLPLLLCPWLSALGKEVEGPVRYVAALFIEVPGVTRMPVVPLISWCALGVLTGLALRVGKPSENAFGKIAGASRASLWTIAGVAIPALVAGLWITRVLIDQGVVPSRSHPIIWANALDLAGRATLAIAVSMLLTPGLAALSRALVPIGQQSLFVYGLHLPFCYGVFASPLKRKLDMTQASLWLLVLYAVCLAFVFGRHRIRVRRLEGRPRMTGLAQSHAREDKHAQVTTE